MFLSRVERPVREASLAVVDGRRIKRTGVCPQCKERVAIIENMMPKVIVFLCPACGNRWSAEEPGAEKQSVVSSC